MKTFPKWIILGFLSINMVACASTWNDEDVNEYEGRMTYMQAVKKWGSPDSKKRLANGDLVAKWINVQSMILPSSTPTFRPSGSYYYTPYLYTPMERAYDVERLTLIFDKNGVLKRSKVN